MSQQTDLVKELFGGIQNAPDTKEANYCRPGRYFARLDNVKIDKNRKKEAFFAVEMTIVKMMSNTWMEIGDDEQEVERTGHQEGESCTYLVPNYGAGKDMFLSNCKTAINGICAFQGITLDGMDDENVMEFIAGIVDADQPLAGLVVEWHATQRETKASIEGKRKYFTRVLFDRTVPDAELEELGIEIMNSTIDEDAASADLED